MVNSLETVSNVYIGHRNSVQNRALRIGQLNTQGSNICMEELGVVVKKEI